MKGFTAANPGGAKEHMESSHAGKSPATVAKRCRNMPFLLF
jgi:hypothetical protein